MAASCAEPHTFLRDMIFAAPEALPIWAIDRAYDGAIPIRTSFQTTAGVTNALLVNCLGRITLVQCRTGRDPAARRAAVRQMQDQARQMRDWTYDRLAEELGQRPFDLVRQRHPRLSEARFAEAVTRNLQQGRLLLLLAGDCICNGGDDDVTSFNASLAFVQMPMHPLPDGRLLVTPRLFTRA